MADKVETVALTLPRFQDVLIGRAAKEIQVDLQKYPESVLLRLWDYGHKRRYNDHQSGWSKDAYDKEMKRSTTDEEFHAHLIETALGCRDDMYAGDWKEGGGATLPRGVKQMRNRIVATFAKRNVKLSVKVTDCRRLDSAEPFAARLAKAIGAKDEEAAAKSILDGWNAGVEKDLATVLDQGDVHIEGVDDVVEELSA